RRRHGREPQPVRGARGRRDRSGVARPSADRTPARPPPRRDLHVAHRAELRPARPRPGARARGGARLVSEAGQWFESDPLWFKRAVFYEIHTRGFFDASQDGSGDLRGIQEKLDYPQWLGIDCIWPLPMYASPLRDGGYDISDYYAVHPDYGTVEDFKSLVDAAH